ncbi:MAG: flagellar motility protein MotE (MotC chaperone) [Planctomycetota bacterium]|jgi:flagellar motility protein MotE (MotC chaperone)
MTKSIELLVMALGGLSLFVCAFLGFAAMSGTPLSDLTLIGSLFAEEEGEPEETNEVLGELGDGVIFTTKQVIEANIGLLSAYALQSPFTADELGDLATELKTAKLSYEERKHKIELREARVGEREELLTDQFETMEQIRDDLETLEEELNLRAAELGRDEDAENGPNAPRWVKIAKLFEKGEVSEHVTRLIAYEPKDAAFILSNLQAKRSSELLNAIPPAKWMEYVEAFSALSE